MGKGNSALVAFFLTFMFGPLGLLYSSAGGGVLLLIIAVVGGIVTGGLVALVIWPLSILWGIGAAFSNKGNA